MVYCGDGHPAKSSAVVHWVSIIVNASQPRYSTAGKTGWVDVDDDDAGFSP